ncbi:Probable cytochrome c2 [plant metagenome]|uniref:Probable cytochrome c2 n=1 Tax=plant metagenome TaxID=1297885 RepID=A0A484PGC7_9ZZZZ
MKRVLSQVLVASGMLLSAAVSTCLAAEASGPAKPDQAKGSTLYEQGDAARGIVACASCHGAAGNSTLPMNPNLAAQSHEYLLKQLHDFKVKEGAEHAARRGPEGAPSAMSAMVGPLTEEDMRNVAYFLSLQKLEQPATAGQESLVERGQQIWRGGIADQKVPACAACHGATGAGIPGQYPRLSGQFPAYIAEQLKLFRSGDRANNPAMHDVAKRMTDDDIKAVSDYAAGLR